ncbi:hypothetical protein FA15DRAFT_346347 [Coprinopsis marcescibilis]|uniref:Rho-GAP domain-containing protein n=1 Tax=Coprinopsis marcescibilis TaxID=230819 RepID=A0A5C3L8Y7_COPMA|nr:hypothetical protein FA15DRAFT_346347 [Coprinopsis marcescibilis]
MEICECLDTGSEFPYPAAETTDPEVPLAFGVVLLRLLSSLPDPVIPTILHPRCVDLTNRDEAFELLDAVQPVAVNVWISLTAFLHFVSKSSENENQAELLASVFAPILLRDDPSSFSPPISPRKKREFLLYFIS